MNPDNVSVLAALAREERARREHAAEVLTGPCPACSGTTRWPSPSSKRGTCSLCEVSDPPGTIVAPRSWWLAVAGREPR